jgi:NAD(P)H-dependent FMN reductase
MLDLKIIIGSTRPGRAADRVISWIKEAAREHSAFSPEVLDLRATACVAAAPAGAVK